MKISARARILNSECCTHQHTCIRTPYIYSLSMFLCVQYIWYVSSYWRTHKSTSRERANLKCTAAGRAVAHLLLIGYLYNYQRDISYKKSTREEGLSMILFFGIHKKCMNELKVNIVKRIYWQCDAMSYLERHKTYLHNNIWTGSTSRRRRVIWEFL